MGGGNQTLGLSEKSGFFVFFSSFHRNMGEGEKYRYLSEKENYRRREMGPKIMGENRLGGGATQ